MKMFILVGLVFASSASAQIVVVNANVEEKSISSDNLRNIFILRKLKWSNGTPIRVFVLKDTAELHSDFSKKLVDAFPYQLRRFWDRATFSGTGSAPTTIESVDDMYTMIENTPGAIGYVDVIKKGAKVKVLRVE